MPSTIARSARRMVPIKSAILAGAAPARRRMVHPVAANHPRRRADDIQDSPAVAPIPHKARPQIANRDGGLMKDLPARDEAARAKLASERPVECSQLWLLAALWGRLP